MTKLPYSRFFRLVLIAGLMLLALGLAACAALQTGSPGSPAGASPISSMLSGADASLALTTTMPMSGHTSHGMVSGEAMAHTMPMSGSMPMMDDMSGMMSMMQGMSPEMKQHMMEMMADMSPEDRAQMMQQMEGMMGDMDMPMGAGHGMTGTMPMSGHDMHQMEPGGAMTHTMPMSGHDMHHMEPGGAMTHTMPMSGTMPMMDGMSSMMSMMQGMSPEMMQHMTDMMKDMSPEAHARMMGMMEGMSPEAHAQMMQQMMSGMDMPVESGHAMTGTMPMTEHEMHHMGAGDVMTGAMSMAGGHATHMAPVPSAGVPAAVETTGGQPLAFEKVDGVKVFNLTATPVRWPILDNVTVTAWTYNGTVPGPMIRVTEGDKVRVVLRNELPEPTTIHWHGIPVPNAMDGMAAGPAEAIQPGSVFTYEFTAPPAGTFMYHSHFESDRQVMVGLYAPLVVEPKKPERRAPDVDVVWMLSEWRVGASGETYAAMPAAGMEANYFTINGKAFPNTQSIDIKKGQRVRVRLANIGQLTHPMHLHGMNFKVVAYDGVSLPPAQHITRNTIPVNPGEIVDIEFVANNVGVWMFHCHVLHHATNDGVEPGGLVALVNVTE